MKAEITGLILPLNEANAIAHTLGKSISFELQLYASSFTGFKNPVSILGNVNSLFGSIYASSFRLSVFLHISYLFFFFFFGVGGSTNTSIAVRITTQEGASQTHTLCTPSHFLERLSAFRDMYNSVPEKGYV